MSKNKPKVNGRPSKYRKEYASKLKKYIDDNCDKGGSFRDFSTEIGVHYDTVFEWAKVHKEFSDAKAYCDGLEERFWTGLLIKAGVGKGEEITETSVFSKLVNGEDGKVKRVPMSHSENKKHAKMSVAAIMFALKNKFPERWKDRQEIDMTTVTDELEQISDEELTKKRIKLEERLSVLRKKHGKDNS
jgi:hypothetical protein